MAYEAKLAEAQAYQAAAKPVATDYPHLQAEVGATAADIAGVAATIVVKSAAWKQVSAAIEGLRLKTKAAIAAATDQAGVDAALTGLVWPSPG